MDYFIDSNIFLRFLVEDNRKSFKECYIFFQRMKRKKLKIFSSSLVLAEVDWVLEGFYNFDKKDAVRALISISKIRGLRIVDNSNFSLALEIYKKYSVKIIDALIASGPEIFGKKMTIISYDKDFDKLGVIRKEPKEII